MATTTLNSGIIQSMLESSSEDNIDTSLNNGGSTKEDITPSYYSAKCICGAKLDPYAICDAYHNIKYSAHHHAVKKLLRAGEGHKSLIVDISEVIDSLVRWKEQLNNNSG